MSRCSRILGEKQGGLGLDSGSENMVGGGGTQRGFDLSSIDGSIQAKRSYGMDPGPVLATGYQMLYAARGPKLCSWHKS